MTLASLRTTFLLSLLATCSMSNAAWAASPFESKEGFNRSAEVDDSELAGMRGGFVSAGGLVIDFALSTRTVIDGVTQTDLIISSNNIDDLTAQNVKQIVQIGDNNNAETLQTLANNAAVLTLIQNSVDNKVIQNFNVLDVAVSNVSEFQANSITALVDLSNVGALK